MDNTGWVVNPSQDKIFCQTGTLTTSRFHDYSPILVSTSIVNHDDAADDTELLNSILTWSSDVDRDNMNFTACYSYTGIKAHHDDASDIRVNFVAYQMNLHRRMSHIEGGMVPLPSWRRNSQCVMVDTKVITSPFLGQEYSMVQAARSHYFLFFSQRREALKFCMILLALLKLLPSSYLFT